MGSSENNKRVKNQHYHGTESTISRTKSNKTEANDSLLKKKDKAWRDDRKSINTLSLEELRRGIQSGVAMQKGVNQSHSDQKDGKEKKKVMKATVHEICQENLKSTKKKHKKEKIENYKEEEN